MVNSTASEGNILPGVESEVKIKLEIMKLTRQRTIGTIQQIEAVATMFKCKKSTSSANSVKMKSEE